MNSYLFVITMHAGVIVKHMPMESHKFASLKHVLHEMTMKMLPTSDVHTAQKLLATLRQHGLTLEETGPREITDVLVFELDKV